MFSRLGRWCYRRRWIVVALWVAMVVVGGGILAGVGTQTRTEFSLPEVESRVGFDILDEHFGGVGSGQSAPIVFLAEQGVEDPQVQAPMERLLTFAAGVGTDTDDAAPAIETVLGLAGEASLDAEEAGVTSDEFADAQASVRAFVEDPVAVDDSELRDALVELVAVLNAAGEGDSPAVPYDDVDAWQALGTVEAYVADLDGFEAEEDAVRVSSPYEPMGADQVVTDGDHAGQLAYADIEISSEVPFEEAQELGIALREHMPEVSGLDVSLGGEMFVEFEEPTAEIVGVAFAIIILIVAFGSVIAMGLPIGVGLAGIGVGTIVAGFLTHVFEVPEFAQMLGVMIGLGVGIDYALFIVTRFRENRRAGQDIEQSITVAINTAGRAVTFAGITVVISLLGMLIMQLGFVTGMAISAATVVAVTMVASVTLLPALVGVVGDRIEVTRWRGVVAAGFVSLGLLGVAFSVPALAAGGLLFALLIVLAGFALKPLKRELPARREKPIDQTVWFKWSRLIQRNPWPAAIMGALLLAVLALPVFGIRMGFADEGNQPTGTDTRTAYDLMAEGFGPGYNGPLLMAADVEGVDDVESFGASVEAAVGDMGSVASIDPAMSDTDAAMMGLFAELDLDELGDDVDMAALAELDDMSEVAEAVDMEALAAHLGADTLAELGEQAEALSAQAPAALVWQVIPEDSPQNESTTELVHDLRDDVLPAVTAGTDAEVAVSGTVAMTVDFTDYLGARLLTFLAAVLALSFVLLMVVFRSVLVPLKAVIMNLLGIGAAYGVIVAIFQWGWGGSLIGVDAGPIEPFMPMMLFAIVFGLSMDYEVFLLSRVKEDWDRTGDSHTSVANGLASTARVITAAALIMMVVFGAFSLGDERILKMAGIGLGFAVFLDATVIRMLLVPATMELLGDRNWWLPGWLDRLLPSLDVEGHSDGDGDSEDEQSPDSGKQLEPVSS